MPFTAAPAAPPVLRVFLSVGHGLSNAVPFVFDSGAVSCFGNEHAIAEDCVDRTASIYARGLVENAGPAFSVSVIETPACSDTCIKQHHPGFSHLSYVVRWLNDVTKKFDYVLAIHLNDGPPDASGVEVYYSKNAPNVRHMQALGVAHAVATSLGLQNRGVYRSDQSQHSSLAVLDDTDAPALLIEMGFVSNKQDVDAINQCGPDALVAAIKSLRGEK